MAGAHVWRQLPCWVALLPSHCLPTWPAPLLRLSRLPEPCRPPPCLQSPEAADQMKQLLRALREQPASQPPVPIVLSASVLHLQLCLGAAAVGQAAAGASGGEQGASLAGYLAEVRLSTGCKWLDGCAEEKAGCAQPLDAPRTTRLDKCTVSSWQVHAVAAASLRSYTAAAATPSSSGVLRHSLCVVVVCRCGGGWRTA